MSKERELLKKAIQIIETLGPDEEAYEFINEILLLEPEQEPVGIVRTIGGYPDESDHIAEWTCSFKYLKDGDKLYLTPPKREPLGVEEINECMENSDSFGFNGDVYIADAINAFENFARAIEKAHGIGVDDER